MDGWLSGGIETRRRKEIKFKQIVIDWHIQCLTAWTYIQQPATHTGFILCPLEPDRLDRESDEAIALAYDPH